MKQRIPTLNEFVDQQVRDRRASELPPAQQTFTEIIVVIEFPQAQGNVNFTNLAQEMENAFANDPTAFRIEQDFGDVGGMSQASIHLKDIPGVKQKFDIAIRNLKFHANVLGTHNV